MAIKDTFTSTHTHTFDWPVEHMYLPVYKYHISLNGVVYSCVSLHNSIRIHVETNISLTFY